MADAEEPTGGPPPEELFSGVWRGNYVQGGEEYPQEQRMEFADGIVRGEGADGVGAFVIEGQYHAAGPGELRIGWIKTYREGHSVLYLGVFDGTSLRGDWKIGSWGETFELRPPA